jgi:hypothetical protein
MKQVLNLFLLLILGSCATTGVPETPVVVMNTRAIATATVPSLTPVPSFTPTKTFTPTSDIVCDPLSADFCIMEGHFVLQRPIRPPGNDIIDLTYGYGSTANGTRDPHHGVEFPNPSGTSVYAAADGTVIFAGPDEKAIYAPWGNFYGNLVIIAHDNDLFTLYAHLSKIDVGVGQQVKVGDKIGEVGRTGGAIGSHLHFEVRRGDVEDYFATGNPELWLIPAKDSNGVLFGILMISALNKDGKLLKRANFTIGYYSDPAQSPVKNFYATPYSPDLLTGQESAVLGELPAGHYRIVVEMNGQILERWVEVESGKLTQVAFVVN